MPLDITWEVEDGYVGKSRPHHTQIPDDEVQDCETEEELEQLIDEYVQEDFDQKVTFHITRREQK